MFVHDFVLVLLLTLCLPRESIGMEKFIQNNLILKCKTRIKGFIVHPKYKHNTDPLTVTPPLLP